MHALLLSFGVIFVAELGDKSQLMALTFAAPLPPSWSRAFAADEPVTLGATYRTRCHRFGQAECSAERAAPTT